MILLLMQLENLPQFQIYVIIFGLMQFGTDDTQYFWFNVILHA